jgi:hypothetical protein
LVLDLGSWHDSASILASLCQASAPGAAHAIVCVTWMFVLNKCVKDVVAHKSSASDRASYQIDSGLVPMTA